MSNELHQTIRRLGVFFRDVVEPLAFKEAAPLNASVSVVTDWRGKPPSPEEATRLEYTPVAQGFQWGPKWATAWFKVHGTVPQSMKGCPVELRFSTATEALLWGPIAGGGFQPIQGLDVNRDSVQFLESAQGGERVEFFIEAACNHPFGVTGFDWDDEEVHARWKSAAPGRFDRCELAVPSPEGWELRQLFGFALGLLKELPPDGARTGDLLAGLRTASESLSGDTPDIAKVTSALKRLLARPAAGSATLCHAVGHAHLDTAWLWPIRETKRKCLRTFSNQLRLMERFPGYKFLCSQAIHYAWVEENSPALFEQIKARVLEGRWEPGGGMWIEPDSNCVSGESLIRQIVHGTGYWTERFGEHGKQSFLYLPDTFGFSGALPQIMKLSGLRTFITNKLHWNATNAFPHTNFVWRGIDGSEVLAHNTPGKDYNATNTPRELVRGEKTHCNKDLAYTTDSQFVPARWLQPFGYGDGGGGPTDWSIRFAEFSENCDGLPRVTLTRADEFCEALHADRKHLQSLGRDFPVSSGELYLELHRGTLTTQAWIKQANCDAEESLKIAELLSFVPGPSGKPAADRAAATATLDSAWKIVLLNQFHDILPGSSIGWVYEDAKQDYKLVREGIDPLITRGVRSWVHDLDTRAMKDPLAVFNSGSHTRSGVVEVEGRPAFARDVPAQGIVVVDRSVPPTITPVEVTGRSLASGLTLSNGILSVTINDCGQITRLARLGTDVVFEAPLSTLALFDDRPAMWDAWDIDASYEQSRRDVLSPSESSSIVESSGLRAVVERTVALSPLSRLTQRFILCAGSPRIEIHAAVEWNESHKLLRALFPTALEAARCRGGIQFGWIDRPTHRNTSHDQAMFEFVAHRWLDLSRAGKGLALLTRAKFGHSCNAGTLGLSLLRSPKHPDPSADIGRHEFAYALMPHEGDWAAAGVHREAESFASPMLAKAAAADRSGPAGRSWAPFEISRTGSCDVQIAAFSATKHGTGLILRLFECRGGSGDVAITWNIKASRVQVVDVLERGYDDPPINHSAGNRAVTTFKVRPFQIVTLRLEAD